MNDPPITCGAATLPARVSCRSWIEYRQQPHVRASRKSRSCGASYSRTDPQIVRRFGESRTLFCRDSLPCDMSSYASTVLVKAAWIRTRIIRIKSPRLYQLSYAFACIGSGAANRTPIARMKVGIPNLLEDTAAGQRWRFRSVGLAKVEAPAGLESAHCALRRRCSTSELRSRAVVPSEVMTCEL